LIIEIINQTQKKYKLVSKQLWLQVIAILIYKDIKESNQEKLWLQVIAILV
jgi:hypothetical protein